MNSVNDLNKPCIGCSACSIVCPKNAISMKVNDEGFWAPIIDENKCISCGLCKNVCIKARSELVQKEIEGKFLAMVSKDNDVVFKSSSGGIAYELYKMALNNGFYVVGSFYDLTDNRVKMLLTNKEGDLKQFQGSKYLQAYTKDALTNAIDFAKQGKKILFIGTPCQVYGARKLAIFNNVDSQFIFVDFYCHGVPSYLLWNKYLRELGFNNENLNAISFRNKEKGWHNAFCMRIESDKKKYSKYSVNDMFYNYFFDNSCFSENCYDCSFRAGEHASDIRLGDFWGKKYKENKNGVSLVTVFNEKGQDFLSICNGIKCLGETTKSESLAAQSSHKYEEVKSRNDVISALKTEKPLKSILKRYRKNFSFKRKASIRIKKVAFNLLPLKLYNYLKEHSK